jgi:hypothetical protein
MGEATLETKVTKVEKDVDKAYKSINAVRVYLRDLEDRLMDAFLQAARTFSTTVDEEDLKLFIQEFIKKPYFVLPRKQNEWWLVVPRFITLEFGMLVAQEGPWNIFLVNKYIAMIQQVPEELREEIDLSTPFNGITIEDGLLHIQAPERDDVVDVHKRYKKYLGKIQDTATINIKKGMLFEAMAALIRDGILPYQHVSVPKSLYHTEAEIKKRLKGKEQTLKLRDYQARDRDIVLEAGAAGIFYPMGGGKSFIALDLIARLKGEKLVLVPNATVAEHWREYLEVYLNVDPSEVTIMVYHVGNAKKVLGKKWAMVAFDEVATLPADTHLQFANVEAFARVFMTATPVRGDGREDLIFALCRNPLGVNWKYFLEHGLVKFPIVNVSVERDESAKLQKLHDLLDPEKKTLVFVDKIAYGRMLAKKYNIPFVSGSTKREDRLQIMRANQWVVVSRIADFGVSMKNIQMVIEADINWASQQQATQRAGRMFHSEEEGSYHGLMTARSYVKLKDRYLLMYSRGLKVRVHLAGDLPADLAAFVKKQTSSKRATTAKKPKSIPKTKKEPVDTSQYPQFDERRKIDTKLIQDILSSEYSKKRAGLFVYEVRAIMKHNHIKGSDTRIVHDIVFKLWDDGKIGGRTEGNKRKYFPQDGFG